jgi:hypothetical protein
MSFADQLTSAKRHLSAREVAAAVSPLLSVRTVEHWLSGYRTPPEWTQHWIISKVSAKQKRVAGRSNTEVTDGGQEASRSE